MRATKQISGSLKDWSQPKCILWSNEIKLEINNGKISGKLPNIWKLNIILNDFMSQIKS